VGMGYAEEAILLSLYIINQKPTIRLYIHGIDIDPAVILHTKRTISKYNLQTILFYEVKSIMDIDFKYLKNNNISCIYTSAAFPTMISLYLFYLCAAANIFMFCSKSIIANILDIQSDLDEKLQIPSVVNNTNTVWYIAARGSLYTTNRHDEQESRHIYIFNIDTITTAETLPIVLRYAQGFFRLAKSRLKKGNWSER